MLQKTESSFFNFRLLHLHDLMVCLILLLITSPAFSIVRPFTGFYFPNEKLAFLLIFFILSIKWFQNGRIKISLLLFLGSFFFALLIVLRYIFQNAIPSVPDLNHVYMLGALPFYFAFFKQQKVYVIRTIHIVILIHCLIGLYQWYMMWTGNTEMAMLFNNYPSQENYVYPEALPETGLYRFSGLFGESSQLSILLSFYYIFFKTYEKGKYQNYFTSLVVFTMIIVNVSLSGYLMIFFYLFFNMVTKEIGIEIHKNNIFLLGFVVIILILFIINGDIENNIGKLTRFVFSRINLDDSSVRMDAFKDKLMVFMEYPFLGKGISWGDTATWDYLSYYLSGYGVLGFLTVSLSILYVVLGSNFNYYVVLGVAFLSNGVILAPFYIIIFSLISLDNKIRNQYQYIKNIKNTNLPLKSSILKP